eukprot:TRINITY_DN112901_c0_g1_i1.p1 TRINITY_DN112901_c0_g1~~TRINITY_DN112901_c0_g1_i1.p1  ORF type:complete len:216 (+),score=12.12 TRINITY_DN112901_c0_g1_i1:38-685(+)
MSGAQPLFPSNPAKGWMIPEFLTEDESCRLINAAESVGFELIGGIPTYRKCWRSQSPEHAKHCDWMWDRLLCANLLPLEMDALDEEDPEGGLQRWQAVGLHDLPRMCKYDPGHHFSRHYDYSIAPEPKHQSLFTFMLYLNNNFTGGDLQFYADDDNGGTEEPELVVTPERGLAVLFQQNKSAGLLHAGMPVLKGTKYIFRTEVIYKKKCSDSEEL